MGNRVKYKIVAGVLLLVFIVWSFVGIYLIEHASKHATGLMGFISGMLLVLYIWFDTEARK